MKNIVIFGCGGSGRSVLQVIHAINEVSPQIRVLGFAVDAAVEHPDTVHGLPVSDRLDSFAGDQDFGVVIAIGDPGVRKRIAVSLKGQGYGFPTIVHPTALIGDNVQLGDGVIVSAFCSVVTDAKIARHVHIGIASQVGHDVTVGEFSTLSPAVVLNGNSSLGNGVFVGTRAVVTPGIIAGNRSVIGAGAVVLKDLPAEVTFVAMPGRIIKRSAVED